MNPNQPQEPSNNNIMQSQQPSNNNNHLSGVKRYAKYRSHQEALFGKIYSGKDLITGKWVAIKECNKWFAKNRIDLRNNPVSENLFEEIKIMKYLMQQQDLPNTILKLLDVVEDSVNVYLILEWANGDLFTFIKNHHQKLEALQNTNNTNENEMNENKNSIDEMIHSWELQIRKMFYQITSAVKWLHLKNVCHLDISLENALLDNNGNIKIIDFGVAKCYDTNDTFITNGKMGKPRAMSPEVWNKQQFDGRLADTWSIGIMLFMIFAGVPWEYPGANAIYHMIKAGRIRDAIMICTNKKLIISNDTLDLLTRIFKVENERIYLDQILKHPFCYY